jgi:restriction system protein
LANRLSINFTLPEQLYGKVSISNPYENFNAKGKATSYGVDLRFNELSLSKTLKSSDFNLLRGKIENTLRIWENQYSRYLDKKHKEKRADKVDELNKTATEDIESLKNILSHTLGVDDTVDWDAIKRKDSFKIKPKELFKGGKSYDFLEFDSRGCPVKFIEKEPSMLQPNFETFKKNYGFFTKLFSGKSIESDFKEKMKEWETEKKERSIANKKREAFFKKVGEVYEKRQKEFELQKQKDNQALEDIKERYSRKDAKAVEDYCDLVLNCSQYPDYFPKNWVIEYNTENKIIIVDYDLPSPESIPTIESYKYIKTRDEVAEKHLTKVAHKKLYDEALYQICIRTIHELFESDTINALEAVAFNGIVTHNNLATGIEETKVIMSIVANKTEFNEFDLSKVNPKATFKHLKGVSATTFMDLTPIPPIIKMDKSDKRFISGRDVVDGLDESINLAAMHWDDFEHLIREIFEKEFSTNGGEVKVTQASSDGGVDAIAFDPDPIRGGKIIIQAKRYTNVVGVAAVRDLYGTVMNEGATKGILVTTSNYGKDSYQFAKDKPLTLLNGNNLLSLLEKHGHKARINIAEAKKIIG